MDTNKCSGSRPFVSIRGFLLRLWLWLRHAAIFVLHWFQFLFFARILPLSDKSACVSLKSLLTSHQSLWLRLAALCFFCGYCLPHPWRPWVIGSPIRNSLNSTSNPSRSGEQHIKPT